MTTADSEIWRPADSHDLEALAAAIRQERGQNVYRPEIHDVIDAKIDSMSDELRAISLDIHGEQFKLSSYRSTGMSIQAT